MTRIEKIMARQVFDSRGTPTVEAEIILSDGVSGRFICPSGASCGKKEALELRDGDENIYGGKGVLKAIANIDQHIAPDIIGRDLKDQKEIDDIMCNLDATPNKSRLGANAILSVSGAFFHAVAKSVGRPLYRAYTDRESTLLPMPMVNVINGGAHANNGLEIQEFMLVPKSAESFRHAMSMVAEVFYALKKNIAKKGFSTAVGDEGGFAPPLAANEEALDLLCEAIVAAKFQPGRDFSLALDVAASEMFDDQTNKYRFNKAHISSQQLHDWYMSAVKKYPICSIEDPFGEDDQVSFSELTKAIGETVQIVGDDLFVTNPQLIKDGIEKKSATAVLIKMNQIGTISETIEAIDLCQSADLATIISHRSGETEDTTIADLAVLMGAGQIKTGSLSRSERVAKYNQLLRIEEELKDMARFNRCFS